MMMAQRAVCDFFRLPMLDQLDIADTRRRTQVIHDRISLVESLRREDMLVGDAFVFISWRRAIAMDDFEKERRPVLHRFGEYLEQITFVIAIDQNAQPL